MQRTSFVWCLTLKYKWEEKDHVTFEESLQHQIQELKQVNRKTESRGNRTESDVKETIIKMLRKLREEKQNKNKILWGKKE